MTINHFKPNEISHCYQWDQSISILRVAGWYFYILNSGEPNQTRHGVASDLGLAYLPMSHKKDARFIWVNSLPTG